MGSLSAIIMLRKTETEHIVESHWYFIFVTGSKVPGKANTYVLWALSDGDIGFFIYFYNNL